MASWSIKIDKSQNVFSLATMWMCYTDLTRARVWNSVRRRTAPCCTVCRLFKKVSIVEDFVDLRQVIRTDCWTPLTVAVQHFICSHVEMQQRLQKCKTRTQNIELATETANLARLYLYNDRHQNHAEQSRNTNNVLTLTNKRVKMEIVCWCTYAVVLCVLWNLRQQTTCRS